MSGRITVRLTLLWALLLSVPAAGDETVVAPQNYLVGVAKRDITPAYPVRLSGFGGRRMESGGITVPIYARALVIGSDEEGPALLIVVDTTGISDAIVVEVAP